MKYALLAATAMLSVSTAKAATFDVYAGYADTVHLGSFPAGIEIPSPWVGDSGVASESVPGLAFDGGAIRITNNSDGLVTVSNFTVAFDGQTFALWPSLNIPGSSTGVFTQPGATETFDTSDMGGDNAVISFDLNGSPFSFTSSGVLDTGGSDPGAQGVTGVNEGLPWSYVGSNEIPTPEPASLAVLGAGLLGLGMVRRKG